MNFWDTKLGKFTAWAFWLSVIGFVIWTQFLPDTSSPEPTIAEVECSQCENNLEEANAREVKLEDCIDELHARLQNIHNEADENNWSDYNSMGDALDNIWYDSGASNWECYPISF